MLYTLSRKLITGNINENTPLIVLKEICDSHGIDFEEEEDISIDEYLDAIEDTEIYQVSLNNKHKSSSYVARFVNKNCLWNINTLYKAFDFLIGFSKEGTLEEMIKLIPNNLIFGQQDKDNIYSINYCICYKICILGGINLSFDSSKEYLQNAVTLLKYNEMNLRNLVLKMDKLDLVKLFLNTNNKYIFCEEEDEITPEIMKILYNDLNNVERLQYYMKPTANSSAISLCAIIYKIDISNLKDPVLEYYNIKEFFNKEKKLKNDNKNYIGNPIENATKNYEPNDKWFYKWYKRFPNFFNLKYQFNPIFPICYYKKDFLKSYLISEGVKITDEKITSLYKQCVKYYEEPNFHQYEQINMIKNETLDMYLIEEIEKDQIICWGSKNNGMIPLTASEILKCFDVNNKCVIPINMKTSLPENCIIKLKGICYNNIENDIYKELLNKIIFLENLKLADDKKTLLFVDSFKKMYENEKNIVKELLILIFEMGMYMRGWKRNSKYMDRYPIKISDCTISGEELNFVEINSIMAIDRYKSLAKDNQKLCKLIENLPLCFYHLNKYEISSDKDIGRNIGERINIIQKGERHKDQNSCIRLSSNYLISSSYRYLVLIEWIPPFDINQIEQLEF